MLSLHSITTEPLERRVLLSSIYVATSGSDQSPGTLGAPLRTIDHAAALAQPGDTVFVRGGTYRETVRPARSGTASKPIAFRPYRDESVTVSGADLVGDWSGYRASIFSAGQSWDLGSGLNQVFVDGRMMNEARWPNTSLDVSRPRKASADGVVANYAGPESVATLTDADLTQPAGAWAGATVHFAPGQGWVEQAGTVTSSAPGSIRFAYDQRTNPKSDRFETPTAGDPYYLTGKFIALDAAGEWFHESSNSTLYLWAPGGDSPARHTVEAKRRQFAFDLRGRSNVHVIGFHLFAAGITTDTASSRVVIDSIDARYVSHFAQVPDPWEVPGEYGIQLAGTDSVVRNSTIAFSAGHGVWLGGARNRAENNVIHDVAYTASNGAPVTLRGWDLVASRNTIYNAGRVGIRHAQLWRGRILSNTIHDVMLQTTDGGGIYTGWTNGRGTEIAYNRIYNVHSGGFGAAGIYLDNLSANHVVHHNVVWDADNGLKLNPTNLDNRVYHNTLVADKYSVVSGGTRDMTGSVFANNVFAAPTQIGPGAREFGNVQAKPGSLFLGAPGGDFRLRAGSPAIDRGQALDPALYYATAYAGGRPDAGAYESGRGGWFAGASAAARGADAAAPAAPSGFTAVASNAGVRLDWYDSPEPDRVGYVLSFAATAAGPFRRLGEGLLMASDFYNLSLAPGETRVYRVVAVDANGNTSAPATARATRPKDTAAPAAPRNLLATPVSGTQTSLAWDAAARAGTYEVQRRRAGETTFRTVATGIASPAYVDSGLTPGASYTYRVVARNNAGVSGASASIPMATFQPPPVPQKVRAVFSSPARVSVSWLEADGETDYVVERRRDNGRWVRVRWLAADTAGFVDTNPPKGRYSYRVTAVGPGGPSAASAAVSVTVP